MMQKSLDNLNSAIKNFADAFKKISNDVVQIFNNAFTTIADILSIIPYLAKTQKAVLEIQSLTNIDQKEIDQNIKLAMWLFDCDFLDAADIVKNYILQYCLLPNWWVKL